MTKIRILFLITDLGRGGAERFLIDHCTELSKSTSIEFKIGVLFDFNQYKEETKTFDIVKLNFETFSLFQKNDNIEYHKLINNFKPHIVHSNRYLAEFLSSYYPNDEITYVCHCHDNMIEFKPFEISCLYKKRSLFNFIEKKYLWWKKYRKVRTYFIANSSHTFSYLQKVLPNSQSKKLVRLDFGFNFDKFYVQKRKQIQPNHNIRILNVGSFQHKKNQNFIIDIAKELLKEIDNFEIHLVGNGEHYEAIKKRVKQENLENNIFLQGIQTNVQDWYKSSDIYLHTAYYEPFGLVFLEAMASGLPIVCLDGKGNRDIIQDGYNGYIFRNQNPTLFSKAILDLYKNHSKYEYFSQNGKDFAKNFDINIQTEKFLRFYESILQKI